MVVSVGSDCVRYSPAPVEMAAVREQVDNLNSEQEQLKRQGTELRREMGAELGAMEAQLEKERKAAERSRRTALNHATARSADRAFCAQQELAAARDDVERASEARVAAEVRTVLPVHLCMIVVTSTLV